MVSVWSGVQSSMSKELETIAGSRRHVQDGRPELDVEPGQQKQGDDGGLREVALEDVGLGEGGLLGHARPRRRCASRTPPCRGCTRCRGRAPRLAAVITVRPSPEPRSITWSRGRPWPCPASCPPAPAASAPRRHPCPAGPGTARTVWSGRRFAPPAVAPLNVTSRGQKNKTDCKHSHRSCSVEEGRVRLSLKSGQISHRIAPRGWRAVAKNPSRGRRHREIRTPRPRGTEKI